MAPRRRLAVYRQWKFATRRQVFPQREMDYVDDMNAITFDTLKFARTLQEQGTFTQEQSSRLVEALGEVLASDLAAKSDVRESELRLEARIAETKADIIRWMCGSIGFQTLVILGAVVTLVNTLHSLH
jgi:hypothetical protein